MMLKNNYQFLKEKDLPKEDYLEYTINNINKQIVTTNMFTNCKNHCAAICLTNLTLYYANRYPNLINNDTNNTFFSIHKLVGNGPKLFISKRIDKYYKQKGYTLKHTYINKDKIIESIKQDSPCALLLKGNIIDYHWVLCIGFRQYKDKVYLRIFDGWHNTIDAYYQLNGPTKLLHVTSYSIRKNGNKTAEKMEIELPKN